MSISALSTTTTTIPQSYIRNASSISLLNRRSLLLSSLLLFPACFLPASTTAGHLSSAAVAAVVPGMDGYLGSTMFPLHRCKTVHLVCVCSIAPILHEPVHAKNVIFYLKKVSAYLKSNIQVRHAQGTHNVEAEKDHKALLSPELFDARLTPLGWEQVDNLRKHVQSSGLLEKLELVIVSPLLRTMQTAVGVFGGEGYIDGTNGLPLMVSNAASSDHLAVSSLNTPPFLAVEKCREHFGVLPCDKRRSIDEYKLIFPAIDFSLIENDEDILWNADQRETTEEVAARGLEFFNWLWTRKEREIAVVTHRGFLYHTLKQFAADCHPSIKEEISKQ